MNLYDDYLLSIFLLFTMSLSTFLCVNFTIIMVLNKVT